MINIINYDSMQEFIIKNKYSIILAKSKNCNVCTVVEQKLLSIIDKYQYSVGFIFIEEVKEFSGQYLVFSVPTILVFINGKETYRDSRFINFDNLLRHIERMI